VDDGGGEDVGGCCCVVPDVVVVRAAGCVWKVEKRGNNDAYFAFEARLSLFGFVGNTSFGVGHWCVGGNSGPQGASVCLFE